MKKYEMIPDESGLYRIRALIDIPMHNVKAGDSGGLIEGCENLRDAGSCWIDVNARATGYAIVSGDAWIGSHAWIGGNAFISDRAAIWKTIIDGEAEIKGNAVINSAEDYIVFKNFWSSGRYFTWTRSNNMWSVGCFYGTGEELIKKAYADSKRSGREYERVVRYVESILEDEKK
mgnify:CR=1 FL=1